MLEQIWKNYDPSPQAQLFHNCDAQYKDLVWGIKGGKTHAGCHEFGKLIAEDPEANGSLYWIVGPTHQHTDTCQFELEKMLYDGNEDDPIVERKIQNKKIYFLKSGARIQLRSGDYPANLRGPNVRGIWVDEKAYLKEESWRVCRQRLAASNGWSIGTTTPAGWNWYWDECQRTQFNDEYGEFGIGKYWLSHYPTSVFPWVSEEFLEDEKASMPIDVFNQEYGALFVASHRGVFNNIQECISFEPIVQLEGAQYVIGLDLAKQQDYTALVVLDGSGQVLHADRWNGVDWPVQRERVKAISEEWNSVVVLDEANVGAVFLEDLREIGVKAHGVATNSFQIKQQLIQALQMDFEHSRITLPNPKADGAPKEAAQLIEELRRYQIKITTGGRIGYSAPNKSHDDFVIALALANWGRKIGLAGGGMKAASISIKRDEWQKNRAKTRDKRREGRRLNRIMQRRPGSLFEGGGGSFWS